MPVLDAEYEEKKTYWHLHASLVVEHEVCYVNDVLCFRKENMSLTLSFEMLDVYMYIWRILVLWYPKNGIDISLENFDRFTKWMVFDIMTHLSKRYFIRFYDYFDVYIHVACKVIRCFFQRCSSKIDILYRVVWKNGAQCYIMIDRLFSP